MFLRNRSDYPTDEVRRIIKFAVQDVDMKLVCVNVKNNRQFSGTGYAYDGVPDISNAPPTACYLITLRIGSPDRFPVAPHKRHPGAGVRFPERGYADWREALLFFAAHEAKHIEQYREGLPASEVRADHFAAHMLDRYRTQNGPRSGGRPGTRSHPS